MPRCRGNRDTARMADSRLEVRVGPAVIVGERREGDGAPVVLLHAGVADRRAWRDVAVRLAGPVVAYDRRGFGETPPGAVPFTHLDDLLAVLDAVTDEPAWLVGNSQGGLIALDAALVAPERVAGLVLIAPAVSGQPEPNEPDQATLRLFEQLEAADEVGDVAEIARLETWLWLDGPAGPEGRVGGSARALALEMNERILRNAMPDGAGDSGLDAWSRLEEVDVPTTVVWGDRDIPFKLELCRIVSARVPAARSHVLTGAAHLPGLEQPAELAAVIRRAIGCP
jgi:pimeloyl-ACP methyl ester carboxylesterase